MPFRAAPPKTGFRWPERWSHTPCPFRTRPLNPPQRRWQLGRPPGESRTPWISTQGAPLERRGALFCALAPRPRRADRSGRRVSKRHGDALVSSGDPDQYACPPLRSRAGRSDPRLRGRPTGRGRAGRSDGPKARSVSRFRHPFERLAGRVGLRPRLELEGEAGVGRAAVRLGFERRRGASGSMAHRAHVEAIGDRPRRARGGEWRRQPVSDRPVVRHEVRSSVAGSAAAGAAPQGQRLSRRGIRTERRRSPSGPPGGRPG